VNKKVIQEKPAAKLPLVVIVGPTASGKSATAMRIAKEYGGEIICADSRTIYKGMDIGTAKPTAEDRRQVPHWGLDLVEPGQQFTAADFKEYANQKIYEIRQRGNLPILVGGTGLYVDGVIFNYRFGKTNPELRKKLEQLSLDE
jgi:tRNA dimethylallyltransferase